MRLHQKGRPDGGSIFAQKIAKLVAGGGEVPGTCRPQKTTGELRGFLTMWVKQWHKPPMTGNGTNIAPIKMVKFSDGLLLFYHVLPTLSGL